MQRVAGRIAGAREIKRISVAAVVSFVSAGLLLRLLIYDGPQSLSFTSWSSPVFLQKSAMAVDDDEAGYGILNSSLLDAPAPAPARALVAEADEKLAAMLSLITPDAINPEMVRVWELLRPVFSRRDLFPEARDGMKDAAQAWRMLVEELQRERDRKMQLNESGAGAGSSVKCPFSVSLLNSTRFNPAGGDRVLLEIPCGMVLDSSVTLVGVPDGVVGDDFRIDLVGQRLPGEARPPIIIHHNVRLQGDRLSAQQPVIVQNTWTPASDWEAEQRCPPPASEAARSINKTVDGLVMCAKQVGKEVSSADASPKWPVAGVKNPNQNLNQSQTQKKKKPWFPYAQGHPFAATLWVGWDGFHVTVDGKHITSFEYRQNLEPWMVSGVSIEGALQLSSVIANGLPTSESQEGLSDLETLKAPPLVEPLDLFIGVFSTGNNFERRMAVRRSWMQYEGVRSGKIAVRFFVGLHQNQQVNLEVWKEGDTYGDIQLLPFVDYYNLITLKTLAICIFGTKVLKSHYVMKTDDDTFVRVDQVLNSIRAANHSHPSSNSLLHGLIETESKPDRDIHSKWYITPEEWPSSRYPPWAHGPGYIFSNDIAEFVVQRHEEKQLKLFKLEDVAMGAWIEEYSELKHRDVSYSNDGSFLSDGCKVGYTIAHYQNPRQMVCLWHQLRHGSGPVCC